MNRGGVAGAGRPVQGAVGLIDRRVAAEGWGLAPDDQVTGGSAHHAFPYASDPTTPDANWATTTACQGREANQAWLTAMVGFP